APRRGARSRSRGPRRSSVSRTVPATGAGRRALPAPARRADRTPSPEATGWVLPGGNSSSRRSHDSPLHPHFSQEIPPRRGDELRDQIAERVVVHVAAGLVEPVELVVDG